VTPVQNVECVCTVLVPRRMFRSQNGRRRMKSSDDERKILREITVLDNHLVLLVVVGLDVDVGSQACGNTHYPLH